MREYICLRVTILKESLSHTYSGALLVCHPVITQNQRQLPKFFLQSAFGGYPIQAFVDASIAENTTDGPGYLLCRVFDVDHFFTFCYSLVKLGYSTLFEMLRESFVEPNSFLCCSFLLSGK